jgi:hypothetical protein
VSKSFAKDPVLYWFLQKKGKGEGGKEGGRKRTERGEIVERSRKMIMEIDGKEEQKRESDK